MLDIFNDDAFSVISLTAGINSMDHIPGRAGELAFVGAALGVATTTITIERKAEELSIIPTSTRGAPSPQQDQDKATLFPINIPHIKKEERIGAEQIQNVRQFGTDNQLQGVEFVINQQMQKMVREHDLTLEFHRLGALRGKILDADASTLLDLFATFGVTEESEVNFALGTAGTDVRGKCATVIRTMKRNVKMTLPTTAKVWALASDEFFDALLNHANVKGVWDGWASAERRLGASFVHNVFEFGGIFFENYQGTDDNSTVAIATDKVRFLWADAPGLYAEHYAPADFLESVNTMGLPRYAKLAPDTRFNQFMDLHTQQNPLPLCLRPKTLMKGKRA